jgi:imidazolonepropionase-like amidohydrolase
MMRARILERALAAAGATLMIVGIASHVRAIRATSDNAIGQEKSRAAGSRSFAIVGVRVFDGVRAFDRATVLVEGGVIKAVGQDVHVPTGAAVVDGTGKTLLPGLIDAHTHAFGDGLERALVFGVTTELDMFTDYRFAATMRAEQQRAAVPTRADLLSAGALATVPGGHGTEFGMVIPTITRADQAQAFVDARIAEGSDYIKIIIEDGAAVGFRFPTLDRATVGALIAAAHRRGKLAIVHATTREAAREALEAGADGLAHVFADAAADPALIALARERRAFVVPTLAVVSSMSGHGADAVMLATDPALSPYVTMSEQQTLNATFPARAASLRLGRGSPRSGQAGQSLEAARETVARLRAAGVPLLAGTDAPNPGTAHGISLHHELALLVGAGLPSAEALAAATSVPAQIFGLSDRGRIAPGLRADLLLVDGDPTRDIMATRRIAAIWKCGIAVERRPAASANTRPAAVAGDGLVSDFDDAFGAAPASRNPSGVGTALGAGWVVSTDKLMGGASEASMRVVRGGANGSPGSLEITGAVKPGSAYPWAGAMFFPGPQPMAPADLSRFKTLVFWARGDGGTYRVLLFATRLGNIPAEQLFTAGPDWREHVVPFSSFGNVDGRDLSGVLFSAGAGPASFRFQIDGVRFR